VSNPLQTLQERHPDRVRAVLNILVETPYFYRDDHAEAFFFLRRHRAEFAAFYQEYYGWKLVMDEKCARVFKSQWYNEKVTEPYRDAFGFRHRDDCLAFMVLLEFFESQLDENALTVEDPENLRFRFGDLLVYTHRRLRELFAGQTAGRYTEEFVRSTVLRRLLPILERYRLLARVPPPADLAVMETDTIYEALPALYHYNTARLSQSVLAETVGPALWPPAAGAADDGTIEGPPELEETASDEEPLEPG
jgi:hypothetical protein